MGLSSICILLFVSLYLQLNLPPSYSFPEKKDKYEVYVFFLGQNHPLNTHAQTHTYNASTGNPWISSYLVITFYFLENNFPSLCAFYQLALYETERITKIRARRKLMEIWETPYLPESNLEKHYFSAMFSIACFPSLPSQNLNFEHYWLCKGSKKLEE